MEPEPFRDAKVELLRAVKNPSPEEVEKYTIRARYSSGKIGSRKIPAYSEEDGVDASRNTETFAEATLFVENERWDGVPFILRTGKAMAEDRQEIRVHFKASRSGLFDENGSGEPDVLIIPFDGTGVGMSVSAASEEGGGLVGGELVAEFEEQKLPAYSMLILRALRGETTFFARGDEAEEAWRVVAPIMAAWNENRPPLREYPAGSEGPS